MNVIEQNLKQVQSLCKKHKVKHLYVFGSVLTNEFNENSDIDSLVRFGEINLYDYFDNLLELKIKLEELFDRKVDV